MGGLVAQSNSPFKLPVVDNCIDSISNNLPAHSALYSVILSIYFFKLSSNSMFVFFLRFCYYYASDFDFAPKRRLFY